MDKKVFKSAVSTTSGMFPTSLRVASYNAASLIDAKLDFCTQLLVKQSIDVLFVQETWWTEGKAVTHPALFHHLPFRPCQDGDSSSVQARARRKHGLAVFLSARLLPFKGQIHVIHEDESTQSSLGIRVGKLRITNVYFSPAMKQKEWESAF